MPGDARGEKTSSPLSRLTVLGNSEDRECPMTEAELFDAIVRLSGCQPRGIQPPFADTGYPRHPDEPVDYEKVRSDFYDAVVGASDMMCHPPLGAPHIDVSGHPPAPMLAASGAMSLTACPTSPRCFPTVDPTDASSWPVLESSGRISPHSFGFLGSSPLLGRPSSPPTTPSQSSPGPCRHLTLLL